MKIMDTEKIVCPKCKVELDVPVYQDNEKTKYGMKYCHQCGAKLHEETIQLSDLKEALKPIREYKVDNAKQRKQIAEYKRLLKMAVPIINNSFPEVGSCWGCANYDEVNDECKGGAFAECADVCKWQYADEALKLIGDESNK